MMLRFLVATLCAAALAGCGSDGNSGEDGSSELSGVLQAGGVQGVHYRTPTRSGSTDAAGTFKYLPGETVSFSIGAIELGSARGAPSITTFTLSGGTPPTTELALRRELDRARRNVTPFVRAVNIQWLLLGLDADHDPANGLDLRDAESRLAGARIDVGQKLMLFGGGISKLTPGTTIHIPAWKAVAEAYRVIGVTVAVHAQTDNRETPFNQSMVTNAFTSFGDGGVRASAGTDLGDDGVAEYSRSWTYDSLGRVKTASYRSELPFGLLPASQDITYSRDATGAVMGFEHTVDEYGDGQAEYIYRSDYQNDTYGFPRVQTTDLFAGDGTTRVSREQYRSDYDARHNQTGSAFDIDSNGDGVLDQAWTHIGEFDDSDRFTGSVREDDFDANGVLDARSVNAVDYGTPHTIVETSDDDTNGDGVVDARSKRTTHYDRDGWPVAYDFDEDHDNDGDSEYLAHVEIRYDSDHRVLEMESLADYDGNGVIDNHSKRVDSFDPIGNLLSSRTTYDFDDDGQLDFDSTSEFHYGTSGELLSSELSYLSGFVTDPPLQTHSATTLVDVADGVLLLAQDYFEPANVAVYFDAVGG